MVYVLLICIMSPSPTWEQTKNQQEEAGGIREASCSQDLLDGQWGRGEAWVTLWTQLRAKAMGEPEERGVLWVCQTIAGARMLLQEHWLNH